MNDIVYEVPVISLKGLTIIPGMVVHFDVSRKRSIVAIEKAMTGNQQVFLVTQLNQEENEPSIEDLYKVGVIVTIKQLIKLPGGVVRVLVENGIKAKLLDIVETDPYIKADIAYICIDKSELSSTEEEAMCRIIKDLIGRYVLENPKLNKETIKAIIQLDDLQSIMEQTINCIPLYFEAKQRFLEAKSIVEEYELLTQYLSNEIEVSKIKKDFQEKVKEKLETNQKEYILREQMKLIRRELKEEDTVSESDTYLEELNKINADQEVIDKINKEIKRFRYLSSGSSEANVVRGYIETLLEMPWNKMSEDNLDIKNAEKILDRDHYGLEKVKERMIEFLAVHAFAIKSNKDKKREKVSPIICLVGPPGTGKTSIAKSVAEALNKKYVRICLGGVRDEAEIRGHRKTYVGAMPGRIATAIKQAGVSNPLMLLDEIDKLGSDHKGDPASALLEVLDSEQNSHFRDHYMEVPINLSEVLFIATANDYQTIPRPLLDRMEIIEVSSYTENEKEHIALEHLVKKQKRMHCLKKNQLSISKKAISTIINGYTKEAGVRNLERMIGKICRKAARMLLDEDIQTVKVTDKNISDSLGKKKYLIEKANQKDDIGIVRGLAWTSVGGDTLEIEVNILKGKGEVVLTGKLGDVMKESAQTGISYIRSVAGKFDIGDDFFRKHDIHIHIPEGSVPKDGPSAGITMATAVLSSIIEKKVRALIAMTGEITLRGRVLPVGGLKEKILAAKKAGIKKVLVPKKNIPDIEEISEEITTGIEIKFVDNMEQVISEAIIFN